MLGFTPSPTELTAGAVAVICFCQAVYERLRNKKKEEKSDTEKALLSDAKMFQDRSEVLAKLAADNLTLYKTEKASHEKTRDYWHEKASQFQATLGACQVQIEEYKQRPDFSQILHHIEQQAEATTEVLRGIRDILAEIKRIAGLQRAAE